MEKYIQVDFIDKLPYQEILNEKWEKSRKEINAKHQPSIEKLRQLTSLASLRFKETKDQEDWNEFCQARAHLGGKISGVKKIIKQHKKIIFIDCLLSTNKVESNYTLIQFISKKIDGKELDKETCIRLRDEFKGNKSIYKIPEDKKPFWSMVGLFFGLKPKNQTPMRKKVKI